MSLNLLAAEIHRENRKWWFDEETGKPLRVNVSEKMMLIVSEIAEAMEGERKNLMDDHLPHRRAPEVELADALIRILDYCGAHSFDIDGAVREKRAYNLTRADHQASARLAPNGKKW